MGQKSKEGEIYKINEKMEYTVSTSRSARGS